MRSFKVAAIQTGPCSDDSKVNLARALRLLRLAKDEHGVDFAVFNELFNIKFFAVKEMEHFDHYFEPVPGPTTNALCEAAAQLGMAIVAGVAERSSSGQYYNSAVAIDRSGRLIGTYRKTHVPVITAPKARATYERHYFSPGDLGLPVFDVDGIRIGVLICYDRHFPEAFRTLALAGAELIAVPAGARTWNVNWRSGIWDALLRTRAYENGVFVVACNRAGEEDGTRYLGASMIVSPVGGTILAQATPGQDDCVVVSDIDLDEVRAFRESVPFRRDLRPEIYRTTSAMPMT
jgi:predicted amidohydrolase